MAYTVIEPEVAGGWGPNTVADVSVHPPRVIRLHYEFADWLGDDLLESFPCFVVSDRLARQLTDSNLSGFAIQSLEVSTTPEFDELNPNISLPTFHWLTVVGRPGADDFGLAADHRLVVSANAMAMLMRFSIEQAATSAYSEQAG